MIIRLKKNTRIIYWAPVGNIFQIADPVDKSLMRKEYPNHKNLQSLWYLKAPPVMVTVAVVIYENY